MPRSTAWPLAWCYAALVVYASLYPFSDWRDQGLSPWAFLQAPKTPYWTGFDVGVNLAGYAPLGFLLMVAVLRNPSRLGKWWVSLLPVVLSFGLECTQAYLPSRVPSWEDWLLNAMGSTLGAVAALSLERMGALARWSDVRQRWLLPQSSAALALAALWPVALLFPSSVPLGLGQVGERVLEQVQQWLIGTPWQAWVPSFQSQALSPATEVWCVAVGGLVPQIVLQSVVRDSMRRLGAWCLVWLTAVGVTALSSALTWGPAHAWAWMDDAALGGLGLGPVLGLVCTFLPRRWPPALALLCLGFYLAWLNQAPQDPYFAQNLLAWEQGRFIRFNGLAQWVGWVWPYAASLYLLQQLVNPKARRNASF